MADSTNATPTLNAEPGQMTQENALQVLVNFSQLALQRGAVRSFDEAEVIGRAIKAFQTAGQVTADQKSDAPKTV